MLPGPKSSDTARQNVQVPKLKTRDGGRIGTQCPSERFSTSTARTSLEISPATPRSTVESTSEEGSRRPSTASVGSSPKGPVKKANTKLASREKRRNSVLGFFSLKEPSSQALADFEKSMRKGNNAHTSIASIPGVSHAKLPPTVPKVNSKWDGIPKAVKDRERRQKEAEQHAWRGSTASSEKSSARRVIPSGLAGIVGTHSKNASTSQHSTTSGDTQGSSIGTSSFTDSPGDPSIPTKTSRSKSVPVNFHSAVATRRSAVTDKLQLESLTTLPEMTAFFSPDALSEEQEFHDTGIKWSMPTWQKATEAPNHPITKSDQMQGSEPSLEAARACHTPPLPDPSITGTGTIDGLTEELAALRFSSPLQPLTPPSAPVEEVVVISSGKGVLGPPASAMRIPKHSAFQAAEASHLGNSPDTMPSPILKRRTGLPKDVQPPPSYFATKLEGTPPRHLELPETVGSGALRRSPRHMFGLKPSTRKEIAPFLSSEPSAPPGHATSGGTPTPESRRRSSTSKKKDRAM